MIPLNKYTLGALLLSCLFLASPAQENLFDYGNTLKFARYLKTSGQFEFAAEEFERLFFEYPGDSTLALELSETYRAAGNCDKLSAFFSDIHSRPAPFQSVSFTREYLRFALKCKTEPADFHSWSSQLPPPERNFYELGYHWVNRRYREAISFNKEIHPALLGPQQELSLLTTRFEQEKYKKPALAALMSAILPGSGKAYTGRWGDAMISFLFVASNSWASYRAFKKKGPESLNGWLFGSLAFSFYSANIWGSGRAAKKYNADLNAKYQNNAEIIIYNAY